MLIRAVVTLGKAFLHFIAGDALSKHRDLLICPLYFLLVVLILVLKDEYFLETLILHLLVVHEQVLQLLIELCTLSLPPGLPGDHLVFGLLLLFLANTLLCLQLSECGLQVGLRLLNLPRDLLQFAVVFLQGVKFNLLRAEALTSVLLLVDQLFLVCNSLILLFKVAFTSCLSFL